VPDFMNKGQMGNIKEIPTADGKGIFWKESEYCAGFVVSSKCEWRYKEMELIAYTPTECYKYPELNCQNLKAYARFQTRDKQVKASRL